MLKIATTIIQNFPKKISCEDVVKKVSSRSLIDMEPRALQGIAAQKEIFVQKKLARVFDISCVLDKLRSQARETKPFKIIQNSKKQKRNKPFKRMF